MDWSNAGKTQLVLFDWCNNTGAIDVKMGGSVLEQKNHLLRCWGSFSLPNWIEALTLSLLLKLPPRQLELLFVLLTHSMKIFSLEVALYLCKSVMHGILLPSLGWCSCLLLGIIG